MICDSHFEPPPSLSMDHVSTPSTPLLYSFLRLLSPQIFRNFSVAINLQQLALVFLRFVAGSMYFEDAQISFATNAVASSAIRVVDSWQIYESILGNGVHCIRLFFCNFPHVLGTVRNFEPAFSRGNVAVPGISTKVDRGGSPR